MTKELKVQLVVSEALASLGQIDLSEFPRHEIAIRGREEMLTVRAIADAATLPRYEPITRSEQRKRREIEAAPAAP